MFSRPGNTFVLSMIGVLLATQSLGGQCLPNELAKLLASDGQSFDSFGQSVSISGDVALIGAYVDDTGNGLDTGSAYVFRFDGVQWVQEQLLLASDGQAEDWFGYDVSVSGDLALIGARFDDDNGSSSGSAYVFRFDGAQWVQEQKLLASDGQSGDEFGRFLSVAGDVALIGSIFDDDSGLESGSAYVFRFDGAQWVQEQKLLASDGQAGDLFGANVSVSGDLAVIGAPFDDDNGADSGSVYMFRFDGAQWVQEQKLLASDGQSGDVFGTVVSLSGDTIVVGARSDDDNGTDSGSVYVFRFDGAQWVQEQKLLASDGQSDDLFGGFVSLSGNTAIIGAFLDDDNGTDSGSAYVFFFDGAQWVEGAKLLASDGSNGDFFGAAVSLSGNTAIIGAFLDDDNGDNSGSAYMFAGLGDCNGNGVLDYCDIVDATSTDLDGNVTPDECDSWLAFNATNATTHDTLEEAIDEAVDGEEIFAKSLAFELEPTVDLDDKAIDLISLGEIMQAEGGLITLADNSTLESAIGSDMILDGELRLKAGDAADVLTDELLTGATGELVVQNNASLNFETTVGAMLSGETFLYPDATMSFSNQVVSDGAMTLLSDSTLIIDGQLLSGGTMTALDAVLILDSLLNSGSTTMSNSTLVADLFTNDLVGEFIGYGEIFSNVTNDGSAIYIGDSVVVGDYLNNGTTIVQIGTLTIIGTLTNNGTIIGEVVTPLAGDGTQPGDGYAVTGGLACGVGASLSAPDPVWVISVGGDFDMAINDNNRFDMAQAELQMNGLGEVVQGMELMSEDIGPSPDGLNRTLPGHYPVGILSIGPTSTVVSLVDNHDNDGLGQRFCEALYVKTLIVDSAAALNTNGCRVYYVNAFIAGAVDDPANLVQIVPPPVCPEDIDGDGIVGTPDLLIVLGAWGPNAGHPADLDGDNIVGTPDLLIVLGAWGPCR